MFIRWVPQVCFVCWKEHLSFQGLEKHWPRGHLLARGLSVVRPCVYDDVYSVQFNTHPCSSLERPRELSLEGHWSRENLQARDLSAVRPLCLRCSSDDSLAGQGLISRETLRLIMMFIWCSPTGVVVCWENHLKLSLDGHWSRENLQARDLSAVRPCA